jgi:hypothetical protein
MRNPRPCVCGHGPEWHRGAIPSSHCRLGVGGADCNFCPAYRPARRTEPLRARLDESQLVRVRPGESVPHAIARHIRQEDTASGAVR